MSYYHKGPQNQTPKRIERELTFSPSFVEQDLLGELLDPSRRVLPDRFTDHSSLTSYREATLEVNSLVPFCSLFLILTELYVIHQL